MAEDLFWSNIFRRVEKTELSTRDVLKTVPIFSDLTKRELKYLERILHKRTYRADEVVFRENEPGVGMYIIVNGKVNILLGKEHKLLALLSKGDFFGEMALLLESPRTATAQATEATELMGFFQPDLFHLLETRPKTGNKILHRLAQMLAERLKQLNIENRQLKLRLTQFTAESGTTR